MSAPPAPNTLLRWRNATASAAVVGLACLAYVALPSSRSGLQRVHGQGPWLFSGLEFLVTAASAYALLAALFMLAQRQPEVSKSLRCLQLLGELLRAPRQRLAAPLPGADRLALLATLLKAFFGPLMAMSLMSFCVGAWVDVQGLWLEAGAEAGARRLFDRWGFWLLLHLLLFLDVLVFTLGYLVETPRLNNSIRSVDPTWLGWAAALACYPPFNAVTGMILGAQRDDFPQFENATVHVTLNGVLLALMAVYSASSLALGWKASNLTHRGIVARGPYAWVRHPAYATKNLAWWIGALPLLQLAFQRSWLEGLLGIASVLGWTALYVLRALTEEDHLRRVDGAYAAYAAKVRHRFIPGLI